MSRVLYTIVAVFVIWLLVGTGYWFGHIDWKLENLTKRIVVLESNEEAPCFEGRNGGAKTECAGAGVTKAIRPLGSSILSSGNKTNSP